MTRINCIDPSHLNDKALSGEWHEIPRVITLAKDAYWKGTDVFNKTMKRVPSAYRACAILLPSVGVYC